MDILSLHCERTMDGLNNTSRLLFYQSVGHDLTSLISPITKTPIRIFPLETSILVPGLDEDRGFQVTRPDELKGYSTKSVGGVKGEVSIFGRSLGDWIDRPRDVKMCPPVP